MAKIMLVEDDNNLREIYEARLLAEGYEIVAAKDGEEALALAVKEKPDLIISDVMMPKISGFDMLDILRSTPETRNTKVIMMTALSQAEDKARADKLGADRYLVKSQVTLEDVAKVAHEVLSGEEGPNVPDPLSAANAPAAAAEPQPAAPAPVTEPTPPSAPATELSAAPQPPAEPPASEPAQPPQPAPATPPAEPTPPPVTPSPPDEPAPVPAPGPAPAPGQSPSSPQADANPAANADSSPELGQTTAAEEAAIDAQINDFVSKIAPDTNTPAQAAAPPAEPAPAAPAPASADTPLGSPQVEEIDVVAAPAADNQPAAPAQSDQPAAPTEPPKNDNDAVTINNKKVIEPIGDAAGKPDLNQLLQKEQQAEALSPVSGAAANPGATVPAPGATVQDDKSPLQNPGAGSMVMPNSTDDPNSISL